MKLRSIAMSGLLGAGLLMMSGCSAEDVADLVGDVLNQNVIYTVNGTDISVTFSVTGATDTEVADRNFTAHLLTGHDNYDVIYTPSGGVDPKSFPAGSVYMYTATTCDALGYLQHEVNANKVNFVNLSANEISTSNTRIVVTQADGVTEHTLDENLSGCQVTAAPSLDGMVLENDMNIKITNGPVTLFDYTVTGLDPDLVAIQDRIKVELIIFDDMTMTIVPMVGYDDLVAIGTGAL